jgi:hypothetical protein
MFFFFPHSRSLGRRDTHSVSIASNTKTVILAIHTQFKQDASEKER